MAAAEYAQNRAMIKGAAGSGWTTAITGLAQGAVDSSISYTLPNNTSAKVRVTGLGNSLYLLTAQGTAGTLVNSQASRRTSMLISMLSPKVNMLGALTTRGSTKIGGSSFINGNDTTQYSGWNCPTPGTYPKMPALTLNDTTNISTSGCGSYSCLSGSPKVKIDVTAADTNTYFDYGNGLKWPDLVGMASKTVSGGPTGITTTGGVCNTSSIGNWGDPNRASPAGACESYFPIIYAPGDLQVTGGVGQGILLVAGNLKVTGGFKWYGPVIVRKDLDTSGTGGHFNGGVMAANVNLDQNSVLGNAVITYSTCVLTEVMKNIGEPRPIAQRPWAELF